jgi:hypothetical protein
MEKNRNSTHQEHDKIANIQNLLVHRYVEQKEAIREGNRCRAIELEFEIRELLREKQQIKH